MLGQKPAEEKPKPQGIKRVSDKKKAKLKEDKPKKEAQLQWFKDRISEMQGKCMECGEPINKHVFSFAIMSIAHVLAKRDNMFPSVATHKDNSIELCVKNGCHDRYDRSWEDAAQMKIWPVVVEKFKKIYPSIAASEKRHLPDILRQEVF